MIPLIINNRRRNPHQRVYEVNQCNLLMIRCKFQTAPAKLVLLNVRYLANRSLFIYDFIVSYNLYFLLMTEMWLTEDNATVLSEAAPANLGLMNRYQTGRKEGGEAA